MAAMRILTVPHHGQSVLVPLVSAILTYTSLMAKTVLKVSYFPKYAYLPCFHSQFWNGQYLS